jgi:predicted RNA-binding Zn-ribbon protein involved in translation (DUF1610 family)
VKLEIYGNKPYSAHGQYEPGVDPVIRHCPFCGSNDVDCFNSHTPSYNVDCNECGAQGPRVSYSGNWKRWSKATTEAHHRKLFEGAIEQWNSRSFA